MKYTFFILIFLLIGAKTTYSQFEWGMKVGISSQQLGNTSLQSWLQTDNLSSHFTQAEYGHHFGLYSRIKVVNIYIEPALLFNSSAFSYTFKDYSQSGLSTIVKNERYNHASIPIMVGLKLGFFRIFGGPVGNVFINKTSELWDFENYQEKFKSFSYGIQGGLGLDIWNFRFDVQYENNLKQLGTQVNIGGRDILLSPNASRFLFTLGYRF
ncbi:MAG: outer membrane beta-barrel protein [Saprospiraceae bacterium]|nr:outer membrane beta-barrel protein [Saprospiraceae bacterium]